MKGFSLQDQRRLLTVPMVVRWGFVIMLLVQILQQHFQAPIQAQVAQLAEPPAQSALKLVALGDDLPIFYSSILWLQAFDNQPGVSIPYANLHYPNLIAWLTTLEALYPESPYPFFLASRIYSNVNDDKRRRMMLEFISDKYKEAPNERWRWMAEASLIAKHRLKDLPLALKYAELIAQLSTSADVPYWAKDMRIILLEELNELESAKILIGALLESAEISDPYELKFLEGKLKDLESRENHP